VKKFDGAARPLTGEVRVPGDKSISHRALILAALAIGRSQISGTNTGTDVVQLSKALVGLGAKLRWSDGNHVVEVDGCGWGGLAEPDGVLDCGNSGTALRLLTGVCSAVDGITVLSGDASIRRRPMLRVVDPLRRMGARIDGRRNGDLAPLAVRGGALSGIDFESPIASAQVKTAVLLAGLCARGSTTVREPAASRDHTERMLVARGAHLTRSGTAVTVHGGGALHPLDQRVPGDISSAMFLVVAGLIVPGSELTIAGVGLNPTRTGALAVLRSMGGRIDQCLEGEVGGEPIGSVSVRSSELHGVEVDPNDVPGLIDEVPAIAVAASAADGDTVISGAAELRVKESDRIKAMAESLSALSVDVSELPDGLIIRGRHSIGGGRVDARGDHRIAMAAAVAALVATAPVEIDGWDSVYTSFPEFVEILGSAQARR
jgi:3-phosphoshikimate 1-carboxyvinyltransferase